ncbi:MAG TPA: AmmeMemoRadiSam system protein B [Desulfobacteraceae bacterium]|nr:AmmeMemoRadiSam system protein B [Desulfobacteraceae bacterium]
MERKKAAFAGSWYPGKAGECQAQIDSFLADKSGALKGNFKAGIVPHAGWHFSGSIACRVIASLAREGVDAVVLFGMHMHPGSTPCILAGGAVETPLGDIPVHGELAKALAQRCAMKKESPSSFPGENTIELQLPFVKHFFPGASIVPVGVPPSPVAGEIGRAAVEEAESLGLDIAVIGSTDMTHYGAGFGFTPAGTGEKAHEWVKNTNDKAGVDALLAMDADAVVAQAEKNHNLCCAGAAAAAVAAAERMGAVRSVSLDYATSYEKNPDSSFVGYCGILFEK